jgi:nucleotide-binding universal stress UspA family protein
MFALPLKTPVAGALAAARWVLWSNPVHMEIAMLKVLVPVDGSENSNRVARYVLKLASELKEPLDIHLLNVQHPLPGTIKGVAEQAKQFHNEEGLAALVNAKKILDDAGVKYTHHIRVGDVGSSVAHLVDELKCDQVVMGTRGMSSIGNMLMGSVATKVLHLVNVPVILVK